ncbi:hypothetical protein N231_02855 [Geobacillus stearothermophilus ATCC 12980]|uniref:Uncharacterized protein n=1 Tax=Geobacillus stearothermophilus TaxID=1422 RepID=A0A3L7DBM4_GEOSE|nr:hypothetical protein AA904_14485 [Geobacillus stearothermophilus]KOR95309.1 hypothetical protein N231_02855 [Geobacillus stearothermophilus ATCC 12980]KMY58065.1 hypothetical protein AA905_13840 [Geobacillus stearothermophilus]KMY63010.1 hypothetical protein AA906_00910 [Geobacillus stearothermophilus]RLP98074.1 hypothetical protein D9545_13370 [Geobacillus stearothermophilus]
MSVGISRTAWIQLFVNWMQGLHGENPMRKRNESFHENLPVFALITTVQEGTAPSFANPYT